MKAYILSDDDFDRLLAEIDRNPQHGRRGGSSAVLSPSEQIAHNKAHAFFNYVIRRWIDAVQK